MMQDEIIKDKYVEYFNPSAEDKLIIKAADKISGFIKCKEEKDRGNKDFDKASNKLLQTMLKNIYLIEHLIGNEIHRYDIWHASNYEDTEYLDYVPVEFLAMWSKEEIEWAKSQFNSILFKKVHNRYIKIHQLLRTTKPGLERNALIDELEKYHNLDFDLLK